MNGFPVSVSQLALGMTNASSALAAAGNSFDQSVALLTAANVTIQDASKSSTGLRTIAARIRNTKTELDALGETENFAKYDKLVQALTRYNVALTDVTGQYRSTFDILQDIAKIWDQLDTMEQAALATQLAGTRQQAVFYSIIEQFKDAEGAMEAMQNSAGTLEESYAYYLDSMSAHVNTFKNAWTEMSATIAQKGIVTSVVDFGTAIVNAANKLAKVHMLLPAIAASILGIKTTMNLIKKESAFADLSKTISGMSADVLKQSSAQQILLASTVTLTKAQKENLQVQIMERVSTGEMSTADAQLIITKLGLVTATKAETAATNGLAASFAALFATNPIGMIMTGITLVTTIVGLVKNFKSEVNDTSKSFSTIKSEIESVSNDIESVTKSYRDLKKNADELIPRYAELANGVSAYGENISLTDEEYEEFLDTQNRLAEIFPEISAGMDENGNAMLNLDHRAEDLTDRLNGLVEKQRELANLRIAGTMQDVLEDIRAQEKNLANGYNENGSSGGIVQELTLGKMGSNEATAILNTLKEIQKETPDAIVNGTSVEAQIAVYQGILDRIKAENDAMWEDFSKTTVAWVHSLEDYEGFSQPVQYLVDALVSTVDNRNAFAKMDAKQIQSYLYDNIISPIESLTPVAQRRIGEMISMQDAFKSGTISAKEYISALDGIKRQLSAQGVDDNLTDKILGTLDDNQIRSKFNTIRDGIRGSREEVDAFLNGLPAGDLEILYSIVPSNGSITMDEAVTKLEDIKNLQSEFLDTSETLNISGMFSDLEDVSGRIDSVTSSMQKLAKGTSLTTKELLKLASEYPQLLKQSNLFTDGSIAGQKKLLEAVLKCNEEQYKSTIQLKLNELKVTIDAIKKQQEVEKEKQKYLLQIYAMTLSGNIENNKQFNIAVGKLNELEAKKYAEIKGGEVKVAAASYKKIDDAAVDTTNHIIDNAYVPGGRALTETYAEAAQTTVGIVYDMHEWIRQIMTSGEEGSAADAVAIARGIADQNTMAYWYQRFNQNAVQSRASYSVTSPDDYRRGIWEEMQQSIQDSVVYDNAIRELEATYDNLSGLLDVKFDELISSVESSSNNSSGSSTSSSSGADDAHSRIKDILNQLLKDLKAFYDDQKKMLKDEIAEEKYLKEQAEKRKTINDIENLIAQLGLDDSAWANKRRIALEEELRDAKEKLAEFEQDKAVSLAEEMYDMEYEKQAAIINALINDTNVTVEEINSRLSDIYKLLGGSTHAVGSPYASGTSNATSGLHLIDEHGAETIFQSANGNRYRMFSGGEKVLSAGASDFLYKFASSYGRSLTSGLGGIPNGIFRNGIQPISMGNIIINGNADERTVSEIRRAQREQMRELLTAFGRMK